MKSIKMTQTNWRNHIPLQSKRRLADNGKTRRLMTNSSSHFPITDLVDPPASPIHSPSRRTCPPSEQKGSKKSSAMFAKLRNLAPQKPQIPG
jgi:hypothetical protein